MDNHWLVRLEERAKELAKSLIKEDKITDVRIKVGIHELARRYVRENPRAKE